MANNFDFAAVETQRKDNVGTILRCATAFGAQVLIIVGSNKVGTHGAHGAQNRIRIMHFYYWSDAAAFLRQQNCSLYTLLLGPSEVQHSLDVGSTTFSPNAALLLRARGDATEEMCFLADQCVHVHFPGDSRAAEKVRMEAKLSICLHQYRCLHASARNTFTGEKFDVIDIEKTELHLHSTCRVDGGNSSSVGDRHIDDTGVMASIFNDDGDY